MKKVLVLFGILAAICTVSLTASAQELDGKDKNENRYKANVEKNCKLTSEDREKKRLKTIDVTLTADADTVKIGQKVMLTAIVPKHGSKYSVQWKGAEVQSTKLDKETGSYISTAIFTANVAGKTDVTCTFLMGTGKWQMAFLGKANKIIDVTAEKTFLGVEARNVEFIPITSLNGNIKGYDAIGETFILWSDGTDESYGTIYTQFGIDQQYKEVSVTVVVEDKSYTYIVGIKR